MYENLVLSKATYSEEENQMEVHLYSPTKLVAIDILTFSVSRDRKSEFLQNYKQNERMLEITQRLIYLIEHCRYLNCNNLKIFDHTPKHEDVVNNIDLSEFNSTKKKCFNNDCINSGVYINCAICHIACWCSESCLNQGYHSDYHLEYCKIAEKHKKILELN